MVGQRVLKHLANFMMKANRLSPKLQLLLLLVEFIAYVVIINGVSLVD